MPEPLLSLGIPKGRLETSTLSLLGDMGIQVVASSRSYKPYVSDAAIKAKILKPRDIVGLVNLGALDLGFAGRDLLEETSSQVTELLDTGLEPVTIVAAVPESFPADLRDLKRTVTVVSEYETLAKNYLGKQNYPWRVFRTSGATEVFPPEDADMIVDNCSTGQTLAANHLKIVDTLLSSTTRFFAHPSVTQNAAKKAKIDDLLLLMKSVLEARKRVILEMNVPADKLSAVVASLPAMKSPTIQQLHGNQGFAVKIVAEKKLLTQLIPKIKALGATDILQYHVDKVIP